MHFELCVIGNPIIHSKSALIHQEFAKQAKLSIRYQKVLAAIEQGGFRQCITLLKTQGIFGCNVTLPFKEQAYFLADTHSERAKKARAANTLLLNKDGSVYADNTDGIGLLKDIQNNIGYCLKNKRILICGAGGAARGILYPIIEQHPASLVLVNRSQDKVFALANEFFNSFKIEALGYQELANREFDVVIDATSFADEALPFPDSMKLSANSLCYDLKYRKNPLSDTLFLAWSRSHGATFAYDGMGMLVEQAAESFMIWTGFMPETKPVLAKIWSLFYEA
jgi:shikimate dehydrogenase